MGEGLSYGTGGEASNLVKYFEERFDNSSIDPAEKFSSCVFESFCLDRF